MKLLAEIIFLFAIIFYGESSAAGSENNIGNSSNYVLTAISQEIVAGKVAKIKWKRASGNSAGVSEEILAVESSDQVRFGSGNYLATRSSVGSAIKERARVLIKVPAVESAAGEIEIIPLKAGELRLSWGVLEPSSNDINKADSNDLILSVIPGVPQIYFDPPDKESPKMAEESNGRRYILEIFSDYYKVFDERTGSLILLNLGVDPKFSPTGRFLVSQLPGKEYVQIFDLMSSEKIFQDSGSAVAFSHYDSFAIVTGTDLGIWFVRTLQDLAFPPVEKNIGYTEEVDGSQSSERDPPYASILMEPDHGSYRPTDGIYSAEREIYVSLGLGAVSYRDSMTSGPDGDTSYEATDPIVYDLYTREKVGNNQQRFADAAAKLVKANRNNQPLSWLSDGDLTVVWSSELNDNVPVKTFSHPVDRKLMATTKGLNERLRAYTVGNEPLVRDVSVALREIDKNVEVRQAQARESFLTNLDRKAAKDLERELKLIYTNKQLTFKREDFSGYESVPLPDPNAMATTDEGVPNLDVSAEGQRFWRWKVGTAKYWLQQTVVTGRRGSGSDFTLLSSDGGEKRYVDLQQAAWDKGADLDSFDLGDIRGELNRANLPAAVFLIDDGYLAISPKSSENVLVFDLKAWDIYCAIPRAIKSNLTRKIELIKGSSILLQENHDNSLIFYDCKSQQPVLYGQFVNGELVLMSPDGFYDGPVEAAEMLRVNAPGLSEPVLLSQYQHVLKMDNLLSKVMRLEKIPPATINAPPYLLSINPGNEEGQAELRFAAAESLAEARLFADGRFIKKVIMSGRVSSVSIDFSEYPGYESISVVAFDATGLASAPVSLKNPLRTESQRGVLMAYAFGVDSYSDSRLPALRFAESDARMLLNSIKFAKGYSSVLIGGLINDKATKDGVLAILKEVVGKAKESDTILLSFAGHGLKSPKGELALALNGTNLDAVESTAILWSEILGVIRRAKARVVITLDVCHSGLTDPGYISQNDAIAERLTNESGASILIFSASKGRQFSKESSKFNGGLFSVVFSEAISTRRNLIDRNKDGRIQISEISEELKKRVFIMSEGQQDPWISRNELFGDFSIF